MLFDDISGSILGLSFTKLKDSYSGSCILVRRSSDDSELDIGFDSYGNFDVSSFNSFVGASQAYCKIWYCQADGYDAEQLTDANQPLVSIINNQPQIIFSSGKYLSVSSFCGAQTSSSLFVLGSPIASSIDYTSSNSICDFSSNEFLSFWHTTIQCPTYYSHGYFAQSSFSLENNSFIFIGVDFDNGLCSFSLNGSKILDSSAIDNPSYSRLTIGKTDYANSVGSISEIILFDNLVNHKDVFNIQKKVNYCFGLNEPLTICIGDSISSAEFCGLGNEIYKKSHEDVLSKWSSVVKSGSRIQDFIDNINEFKQLFSLSKEIDRNAFVFLGTNDIFLDSISGLECYQRLKQLVFLLRNNGIKNICVITCLPRLLSSSQGSIDFNENRTIYNNLIKNGDDDGVIVDDIIDVDLFDIGINGEQDSPTNYALDYTHLNASGCLTLANQIKIVSQKYKDGAFNMSYLQLPISSAGGETVNRQSLSSDSSEGSGVPTQAADLTISLEANKKYYCEWTLSLFNSTNQPVLDVVANYPSSYTSVSWGPAGPNEVLVVSSSQSPANGTLVARASTTGGGYYGSVKVFCVIQNGSNAGDLEFYWKSASSGGTTVIKSDVSFVEFKEI